MEAKKEGSSHSCGEKQLQWCTHSALFCNKSCWGQFVSQSLTVLSEKHVSACTANHCAPQSSFSWFTAGRRLICPIILCPDSLPDCFHLLLVSFSVSAYINSVPSVMHCLVLYSVTLQCSALLSWVPVSWVWSWPGLSALFGIVYTDCPVYDLMSVYGLQLWVILK